MSSVPKPKTKPKPRPLNVSRTRGSLVSEQRMRLLRNQIAQSRNRMSEPRPIVRGLSSNTLTRKIKHLKDRRNDERRMRGTSLNNMNVKDRKASRERWKKLLPEIQLKKKINHNNLQLKMMKNPYVISEKLFKIKIRDTKNFEEMMERSREYDELIKEYPSDLIHFLIAYHFFLMDISRRDNEGDKSYENIEMDDRYPSVKEMGDIYVGQGVNGVVEKLREIDIDFMKKNKDQRGEGIPKLRGAYFMFWRIFIDNYKFKNELKKVIYYGLNDGRYQSGEEEIMKQHIKYLKEDYIEEHPTDTRCELVFFLSERWRSI